MGNLFQIFKYPQLSKETVYFFGGLVTISALLINVFLPANRALLFDPEIWPSSIHCDRHARVRKRASASSRDGNCRASSRFGCTPVVIDPHCPWIEKGAPELKFSPRNRGSWYARNCICCQRTRATVVRHPFKRGKKKLEKSPYI